MKYIKIRKTYRPIRWIMVDNLFSIIADIISIVESVVAMITFGYVTIIYSDHFMMRRIQMQIQRRSKTEE